MGPAQQFADQPADVVELRIVRREQPVGAHSVERIENAPGPVGVEGRRLPCGPGASEALGRGVEPLLNRVEQFLRRSVGALGRLAGPAHLSHSASSASSSLSSAPSSASSLSSASSVSSASSAASTGRGRFLTSPSSAHKAAGDVQ